MRDFIESYPYGSNRAAFAPPTPDTVHARVLAATVVETFAVLAGAVFVAFAFDGDVWVRFGTGSVTAAVPSADVTDGTGSELNPAVRRVPSGATHIAIIAEGGAKGSLSFWG